MPARDPNLQKHTLNLRYGDMDYIATIGSAKSIPASTIVRTILSNWIDDRRKQETQPDLEGLS